MTARFKFFTRPSSSSTAVKKYNSKSLREDVDFDNSSLISRKTTATLSDSYPLPEGWIRAYSKEHQKHFFVNEKTRTTTWIDPRDELWKPKTWKECDPHTNETPLGWEIEYDELVGMYFVNHLEQINLLDDPRTNMFSLQVDELRKFIEKDSIYLLEQKKKKLDEKVNKFILKEEKWKKSKKRERKSKLDSLQSEINIGKQEWEDLQVIITEIDIMTSRLEKDQTDQLKAQRVIQKEIDKTKLKIKEASQIQQKLLKAIDLLQSTDAFLTSHLTREEIERKLTSILLDTLPKELIEPLNQKFPGHAETIGADLQIDDVFKTSAKTGGENSKKVMPLSDRSELNDDVIQAKYEKNGVTRVERELDLLQHKKKLRQIKRKTLQLESIIATARSEIEIYLTTSTLKPHFSFREEDGFPWIQTIQDFGSILKEKNIIEKLRDFEEIGLEELTIRDKLIALLS